MAILNTYHDYLHSPETQMFLGLQYKVLDLLKPNLTVPTIRMMRSDMIFYWKYLDVASEMFASGR